MVSDTATPASLSEMAPSRTANRPMAAVPLHELVDNGHGIHAGALLKVIQHDAFIEPQLQNRQFTPAGQAGEVFDLRYRHNGRGGI